MRVWRRSIHATIIIGLGLLLSGCHGGTLDVLHPEGSLGHEPPPAVNLPPQDAGMENR